MRVIFVVRRKYVGLFFQQSIHRRKEKLFAPNWHLLLSFLLLLFNYIDLYFFLLLLLLFNYINIYIYYYYILINFIEFYFLFYLYIYSFR